MAIRNYQELSSYDFERLVSDLLDIEWGAKTETFPPGADGGIDVRLLRAKGGERRVAQCKHSPGKTWSDIRRAAQKEAAAASKRDLREYWFVTSAKMNAAAKSAVASLFSSQDLVEDRVWGADDVDKRLDMNPAVERRNVKLYLTSAAVLDSILHSETYARTGALVQEILDACKYFVQSEAYGRVEEVLENQHVCIVSGEPGIGKTTLCEMLGLKLIDHGYSLYAVTSASEVLRLWKEHERQVFFYDDFLGQTSLSEKLGRLEDQELDHLIRQLRRSPDHLMLLSTREYILETAKQTYPLLDGKRFSLAKVLVDLSQYTEFQKGQILYNHVYFSSLGKRARKSVRINYPRLIRHQNYNPRLIALLIDEAQSEGGDAAEGGFARFAEMALDHPEALWKGILEAELGPVARSVLLVLATCPASLDVEDLLEATQSFCAAARIACPVSEFTSALRILEKVFVRVQADRSNRIVSLRNPGIRDFLVAYCMRQPMTCRTLFGSLAFADQVQRVVGWIPTHGEAAPAWGTLSPAEQAATNELVAESMKSWLPLLGAKTVGATARPGQHHQEWGRDRVRVPELLARMAALVGATGIATAETSARAIAAVAAEEWDGAAVNPLTIADTVVGLAGAMTAQAIRTIAERGRAAIATGTWSDPFDTLIARRSILGVVGDAEEMRALIDDARTEIESFLGDVSLYDPDTARLRLNEIDDVIEALDIEDEWWQEREEAKDHLPSDEYEDQEGRTPNAGVVAGDDGDLRDLFSTLV